MQNLQSAHFSYVRGQPDEMNVVAFVMYKYTNLQNKSRPWTLVLDVLKNRIQIEIPPPVSFLIGAQLEHN